MKRASLASLVLIAGLIAGASSSCAPPADDGPIIATSSVPGGNQKIDRLNHCISHFREARSGWTQEVNVEHSYTKKIEYARHLIGVLADGQDVPQKDVDEACKSPDTAPY